MYKASARLARCPEQWSPVPGLQRERLLNTYFASVGIHPLVRKIRTQDHAAPARRRDEHRESAAAGTTVLVVPRPLPPSRDRLPLRR
jgi:hypothetical protein